MSQIFRRILAGWKDYKYRFSPWLAVNLGRQIERSSQKSLNFILKSENEYTQDLLNLFTDFAPPNILLLYKDNLVRADHFRVLHKFNADILLQKWGFTIEVRPSLILGGGRGVFVTQGRVSQGQIVGLYPGVVYQTGQPIMFQSIQNPYILRCVDATNVDGHDLGLSRVIFKSIHGRERVGMSPLCDISWLRDKRSNGSVRPANPLNIGQIVNNASDKDKFSANVTYHELDISLSEFEPRSRLFIPNIHYESVTLDGRSKDLRIVPLIATRDIEEGEELYSSYFSSVVK